MNKPDDETLARLRLRIGELCGYERKQIGGRDELVRDGIRVLVEWSPEGGAFIRKGMPDYTGSLDAVHEAEERLIYSQSAAHHHHLVSFETELCNEVKCPLHAPAWARCAALDRTLSKEPIV